MRSSDKVLTELSKQAQNKEYQFERIYRILCNPFMYIKAYSNIYSNNGSSTSGSDSETADGFNETRVNDLIEALKNESYQAKPVRRTYIRKKNGKLRPLGIPNFYDRLLQEVCRMLLEVIYEPTFSEHSHGFRPNRSCHTALTEIKKTFTGANWFIEGDIKGCFDNINHQVLMNILRKKIKDERFINLIWKFLKAGYLEDFKYHNTFSGTPQGGIISPILANIYMNELDRHVTEVIKKQFTCNNRGNTIKHMIHNPEYIKLSNRIGILKKKIEKCSDEIERQELITESKELRKQRNKMPKKLGLGDYKNIQYVRYADDFILAVLGNKEDAVNIKNEIGNFLTSELCLELSEEKTLITHGRDKARFLNYELCVKQNDKFFVNENGVKKRTGNLGICLYMPRDVMIKNITDKKIIEDINAEQWKSIARFTMQSLSDLEIVTAYNAEMRGLYNYYSLAENVSVRMNKIHYLMQYSCLRTLAGKHKTTVSKTIKKYKVGKYWGIKYNTKKETGKVRYFYNQGFPMKEFPMRDPNIDKLVNTKMYTGRTELERRISAKKCELCGKENVSFEIHHVNKVKNLKGKTIWERCMIERNRKTLVLCHECHMNIHY